MCLNQTDIENLTNRVIDNQQLQLRSNYLQRFRLGSKSDSNLK